MTLIHRVRISNDDRFEEKAVAIIPDFHFMMRPFLDGYMVTLL
ncbi:MULTISPECIES: hypothetical protein [unclassified Endozoicomonas]|nr:MULTISPECIES: hypothetical protein [unclassified Endozoicomonas]